MEPRISILTLGVKDLPAMRHFYSEKLDWQPVAANQDIVFFKLNGLLLSLYGRKPLAESLNLRLPANQGDFQGFTLAYNVASNQQVLDLHQRLMGNGVRILREPSTTDFGGLFFYFADPEGNVWEVAYNPYVLLDEQGNVVTHYSIDHL